jgi:hypothetical protein
MRHIVLSLAIAFGVASTSFAANNLFLPGDAFFPTELTDESLKAMQGEKAAKVTFRYSNFGAYDTAFCGFAGYSVAQIPAVDATFISNLRVAYNEIRKFENKQLVEVVIDGRKQLRETNGARALIYPESFDFPRFKIALQYNENWVEEATKFGHDSEHLRLCEFVNSKDAVAQSWRDAKKVGSFDITLPKVELKPLALIEEPVIIKDRVKAIVVPARPLEEYFRPTESHVSAIFVVTSKDVVRWEYLDNEWKIVDPE